MFKYWIYYKHTFGVDVVNAWSKKQAIQKAVEILKEEFENIEFPVVIDNNGERETANDYVDFIEEIWKQPLFYRED